MRRWLLALGFLAGCDKLLGLTPLSGATERRWQAVAVGGMHTCALEDDGALWCWGDNTQGQIGLGLPLEIDEPARVGSAAWTRIVAGDAHTCGLQSDASLWCWGRNDEGQTGTGAHGIQTTNVRLALVQSSPSYETPSPTAVDGSWSAVAAGTSSTCGLRIDGSLWCWGDDRFGQLADPELSVTRPSPRPVGPADMRWTSIAVGAYHGCALASDGSLWCWGLDDVGQLGPGTPIAPYSTTLVQVPGTWKAVAAGGHSTCGVAVTGELACWGAIAGTSDPTMVLAGGAAFGDIDELSLGGADTAAGPTTTVCARRGDGTTWCFGNSLTGQLGPSGGAAGNEPHAWPDGTWTQLAVGASHTCALGSDASLWCVGTGARGQLGNGGTHHAPTAVAGSWQAVSGGTFTTCGIDASGGVACAGLGVRGALGTGDELDRSAPSAVALPAAASAVSGGDNYACAITAGPQLWCWGDDLDGELGDNNASGLFSLSPVKVGLAPVAVATSLHTCAIDTGKNVFCWGRGYSGELGTGESVSASPGQVPNLSGDEIVVGASHTCARTGGSVWCWGNNVDGECGIGFGAGSVSGPALVALQGTAIALAAGGFHTCALDQDRHAHCWGYNAVGQLGIDGLGDADTPALLGSQTWSAISAGMLHTCGIQTDGSLWCWGDNDFGQLGDGTLVSRGVPTRVADGGKTWVAVAAGGYHTCATASDGSTWCWGDNDFGQLATGDASRDVLVPVAVP